MPAPGSRRDHVLELTRWSALWVLGVVLLLAAPTIAGTAGSFAAPALARGSFIGVAGANPLEGAAASLAAGHGPAGGRPLPCQVTGASATCGASTLPLSGPKTGHGNGTWVPVVNNRYGAASAYDPLIGRVVLFGGSNGSSTLNDTWEYRGGVWDQLLTTPSPGNRVFASMTFDFKDNYVLLFGGYNGSSDLNDTWAFQSNVWTRIVTPVAPSPRAGAALAYDVHDGYVVLFGGTGNGSLLGDTWTYKTGVWTPLAITGPSARAGGSMDFDHSDNYVVLFGGNGSLGALGDTWHFRAGAWTQNVLASSPGARAYATFTWDINSSAMILVDGFNSSPLSDVWQFQNHSWTQLSPGPSARSGQAAAFDLADNYLVVVGGRTNSTTFADTWSYFQGSWSERATGALPSTRSGASLVWDQTDHYALLFGGWNSSGFLGDSWTYSAGSWTLLCSSCGPSARADAGLVFDITNLTTDAGTVLLFGGVGPSGYLNDTWEYASGSWSAKSPTTSPSPRAGSAVAQNGAQARVFLFGGENGSGLLRDTWEFTGSTWTLLTPLGTPPSARAFGAATYDPPRASMILFGGHNSSGYLNDTWKLTGSASTTRWTQVTGPAPSPRSNSTLAWDVTAHYAILFGGQNAAGALGDMWIFNANATWTPIAPAPIPAPRSGGVAAFDAADLTVVLFGGNGSLAPRNDTWLWALFVVRISAAPNPVDALVGVALGASVFGGEAPYSYFWRFGDGSTSHVASPPAHAFAAAGNYTVSVEVNDSSGNGTNATDPVVVYPALVGSAGASPLSTDTGLPVAFNGSYSGGSKLNVSERWNFGDGNHSTSANATHSFARPGAYAATLFINDSAGGAFNRSFVVQVAGVPMVAAHASPSVTDVGLPVSFSSNVSGGTGPYTYHWTTGDGSTNSSASFTHTYAANGSFAVHVTLNDSVGDSSQSSIMVTVNPTLGGSASASPNPAETGALIQFHAVASGGTAPYSYSWLFGDGGRSAQPTPTHAYVDAGTYTATLWVNDSVGGTFETTISVSASTGPQISQGPGSATTDAGVSVPFNVTASGGTSALTYTWLFGDGGKLSGVASSASHSYPSPGTYVVRVYANDSAGGSANQSATVIVNPDPAVAGAATPTATDVGISATFVGNLSGGTLPLTVNWSFGDGSSATSVNATHAYTTPGMYTAHLSVRDSVGKSAIANVTVNIAAVPTISSFSAQPASITLGASVTLTVAAQGGTGSLSYAYSGLPNGCSAANRSTITCTPSRSGSFTVIVAVSDQVGGQQSAETSLTVAAPPSSPSGSSTPWLLYGAIAAIVLLGIAGILFALGRRKPAAPSEGSSTNAPAAENPSEPAPEGFSAPDPAPDEGTP